MCWHCNAQSKLVTKDLIPGFHVHRTEDNWIGVNWENHYCPEPVFTFEVFPGEVDIMDGVEYPKGSIEAAVQIRGSVEIGYAFISACKQAGWDEEEPASLWFIRKILEVI